MGKVQKRPKVVWKCTQARQLHVGPLGLGDTPLMKELTWSFCTFTTDQNFGAQGRLPHNLPAPGSDIARGTLSHVAYLKSHHVLCQRDCLGTKTHLLFPTTHP